MGSPLYPCINLIMGFALIFVQDFPILSISHVIVFLSLFVRFLSVHTSRELSGATDIAHTGDNQQSDSFADFFAFRVSVGVRGVVRQSTPCFLPQSQAYIKQNPRNYCREHCKGRICPLYGGQGLIFFNNLYEALDFSF